MEGRPRSVGRAPPPTVPQVRHLRHRTGRLGGRHAAPDTKGRCRRPGAMSIQPGGGPRGLLRKDLSQNWQVYRCSSV
eukprot:6607352-Alexandrium_andersonii.AAC.1